MADRSTWAEAELARWADVLANPGLNGKGPAFLGVVTELIEGCGPHWLTGRKRLHLNAVAQRCGLSRQTVRRRVDEMVSIGLLAPVTGDFERGRGGWVHTFLWTDLTCDAATAERRLAEVDFGVRRGRPRGYKLHRQVAA